MNACVSGHSLAIYSVLKMDIASNPQIAVSQPLHDLPSAAVATFLALFPIVNPVGSIPLFFSLTTGFSSNHANVNLQIK